ncbi:hypothetical protein OIO90_005090 [Microbotryomycetes sp. JL221]|nr:hypothetical protein OIO90_005090 [Microbotryomycetes sp. JL221]
MGLSFRSTSKRSRRLSSTLALLLSAEQDEFRFQHDSSTVSSSSQHGPVRHIDNERSRRRKAPHLKGTHDAQTHEPCTDSTVASSSIDSPPRRLLLVEPSSGSSDEDAALPLTPPSAFDSSRWHQRDTSHHRSTLNTKSATSTFTSMTAPTMAGLTIDTNKATSSAIRDSEQDEDCCPVCLCELSLKLQGEKPHVVPICGHQLHHDCFEAVYGPVQRARAKPGPLGLCGVCRRDMKIGESGEASSKRNKFAALVGFPDANSSNPSFKQRSVTKGTLVDEPAAFVDRDPLAEDDLVGEFGVTERSLPRGSITTTSSGGSTTGHRRRGSITRPAIHSSLDVVRPILSVLSEHLQVERNVDRTKTQHLTCMVTIQVPSRVPAPLPPPSVVSPTSTGSIGDSQHGRDQVNTLNSNFKAMSVDTRSDSSHAQQSLRPSSPAPSSIYSAYVHGSTAPDLQASHGAFSVVVDNLRRRMYDWKGHSIEEFGALRLFDHLMVRKQAHLRQFIVYLFEEAVLFVADDKSKGFAGKIVDNITGDKEKLRLKGRVYVRHIWSIVDTSTNDEQSLTVRMSEDALEEFVLMFNERSSLELWRTQIEHLMALRQEQQQQQLQQQQQQSSPMHIGAFNDNPAAASPKSRGGMSTSKSMDTFTSSEYSGPSHGHLSAFSGLTRTTASSAPRSKVIYEEEQRPYDVAFGQHPAEYGPDGRSPSAHAYTPFTVDSLVPSSSSTVATLDPRNFPSLDLMLILNGPSSLKSSIVRSCLDFVSTHVGSRTRISLVVFSSGEGSKGMLKKTPFISVGTRQGMRRFESIVNEVGVDNDEEARLKPREGGETGFVEHREDRVNVVTACNVALDLVLQRKAKSALTGMVLMSDGRDGAQKQQMDLVLARAEAASVPIHALGWGKSHDPSTLWMLANQTGGTYTFVKDFYDLRDALAGCVGGILSIATTKTQLHISIPEKRWFRVRKVSGCPSAIVSSEGADVDVDLGEMRYGEKKELLIEVDMSFEPMSTRSRAGAGNDAMTSKGLFDTSPNDLTNATDAFFFQQTGINPSSLDDYSPTHLYEDCDDGMPDEVPVLQVNASFRDPVAGKTVSRLSPTPKLLTITVVSPHNQSSTQRKGSNAGIDAMSRQVTTNLDQTSSPDIVRRRMELLSSDMLSRSLLLMTRHQDVHAKKLLDETERIIGTIQHTLRHNAPTQPLTRTTKAATAALQRQREAYELGAKTLSACSQAVTSAADACVDRLQFEQMARYSNAHLSLVLRDQKSWTAHTAVESLYFTTDVCRWIVDKSRQWVETR